MSTSPRSPKRRLVLLGVGTAIAVATLGLAAPSFADTLTPSSSITNVSPTLASTHSTTTKKKKQHHKKKHHKKSTSTSSTATS